VLNNFICGNSLTGSQKLERGKIVEKINITFGAVDCSAVSGLGDKDNLYSPASIISVVETFETKVLPTILKSLSVQLEYDRVHD
jgi:hypothetical protein